MKSTLFALCLIFVCLGVFSQELVYEQTDTSLNVFQETDDELSLIAQVDKQDLSVEYKNRKGVTVEGVSFDNGRKGVKTSYNGCDYVLVFKDRHSEKTKSPAREVLTYSSGGLPL